MSPEFQKAFPEIKSIKVWKGNQFVKGNPIEDMIPQSFSCQKGYHDHPRFNLWDALKARVAEKSTEGTIGHMCQGWEKMNRTQSRECMATVVVTYEIEYH